MSYCSRDVSYFAKMKLLGKKAALTSHKQTYWRAPAPHTRVARSQSARIRDVRRSETQQIQRARNGSSGVNDQRSLKGCDGYGISLDWLYRGDRSRLPHHLAIEIARIEGAKR